MTQRPKKSRVQRGENSRGVRNNNPGNIDHRPENDWVGELPHDPTVEPRFCRFDCAENGIRAMAIVLQSYQRRGIRTLADIVTTWAPPSDNNATAAYIQRLVEETGIPRDEQIDAKDYDTVRAIVVAKIQVECAGYEYPDEVIDEGLRRAGLVPPAVAPRRRDLAKAEAASSRGVALTAVAAAGAAEEALPGGIAGLVDQARPIWTGVQSLLPTVPIGQALAVAAGVTLAILILRRTGLLDRLRGSVGL